VINEATMYARRHFGVIVELRPDGGALIRRLDGRGFATLDAIGAERLGAPVLVGARLEFEIGREQAGGSLGALNVCSLAEGARRLIAQP
jgi:hypothetical protein